MHRQHRLIGPDDLRGNGHDDESVRMLGEAAHILLEYLDQERLAKLGFSRPLSELDEFTAQAFLLIDREFDRLRAQDSNRKR